MEDDGCGAPSRARCYDGTTAWLHLPRLAFSTDHLVTRRKTWRLAPRTICLFLSCAAAIAGIAHIDGARWCVEEGDGAGRPAPSRTIAQFIAYQIMVK